MKKFNVFLPFLLLLVSCATAPKAPLSIEGPEAELSLLPAGGKLYIWADTVKSRPLLDVLSFEGKSGKDVERILDLTKSAAAVFFPDQERRFYIAASGNYPSGRANISFAFSKLWKKQKSTSGQSYWFSKTDNIALSLGSKLALVSNVDPYAGVPPQFSAEMPPRGFYDFSSALVLSGWMINSAETINPFLELMGIPLQIPAEDFFFGVAEARLDIKPWELVFKIKTASASHARSLLSLFQVARLFVSRGAEPASTAPGGVALMGPMQAAAVLLANVPEQDGEYLTLRTASLNEGEIALLFNLFSLYSN